MENLLLAEKTATNYDACDSLTEQKYKSLLANRCTFNPKTVARNWEGTQTAMLLENLENKTFDILRDIEEFKKLQERIKTACGQKTTPI